MKTFLISLLLLTPACASAQGGSAAGRLDSIEARVKSLEAASHKSSLSAFNPALGMAVDGAYRYDADGPGENKGNFLFRAAELNIEAPVDPFLKAWAIINARSDEVEAEEAALQTTALPGNLTVTAGRLFAFFGRFGHFHDHELPVIDRPMSVEEFIGGESQGDGVELSYLVPVPFYLNAVLGAYNKIGGENGRAANDTPRRIDHFTYLGRLSSFAELGDDNSIEFGISSAWTPKRTSLEDTAASGSVNPAILTRKNTWRTLTGLDLVYRYQPARGGIYRGVDWGTEVLVNNERRIDGSTKLPTDRVRAFGGYSYLQFRLSRRWRIGSMLDLTEDLDSARTLTRTVTGFLTWDVTEFQRLRLAGSRESNNVPGRYGNTRLALQWTAVLGHHVHGFRDR